MRYPLVEWPKEEKRERRRCIGPFFSVLFFLDSGILFLYLLGCLAYSGII